jgi:spermidine/putrescine transport system substrate-binding protein
VLRSLGVGALAVSPLGALAACDRDEPAVSAASGSPSPTTASPTPEVEIDWEAWWAEQEIAGELDFANRPFFIDSGPNDTHPSLELFTEETGIVVDYSPEIEDTGRFVDLIRPALAAGEPTGHDLLVITNGPDLSELIGSGWLIPLDHTRLPHFAQNAGPLARGPAWDPENRYSLAWQSGLTGIAYAPEAAEALGRLPSSIRDLWDPALAGRVGMMSDPVELGSAGLLSIGLDPATSSPADWRAAAERLRAQRDEVAPRYYAQGYVDALSRRDTWITMAWSSDLFQLNHLGQPDLRFVVPEEGAMLWTDNLVIPAGAAHPLDALTYMDFVYRVRIAAMIADWVWYLCPVPAAEEIVARELDDPEVARSPLVFPGEGVVGRVVDGPDGPELVDSRVRNYVVFEDRAGYESWAELFEPIVFS